MFDTSRLKILLKITNDHIAILLTFKQKNVTTHCPCIKIVLLRIQTCTFASLLFCFISRGQTVIVSTFRRLTNFQILLPMSMQTVESALYMILILHQMQLHVKSQVNLEILISEHCAEPTGLHFGSTPSLQQPLP